MNGEFISIDTAERIAKLEKENKRLKNGLKKAINKICEQDVRIIEAIEFLSEHILATETEEILIKILRGDKEWN